MPDRTLPSRLRAGWLWRFALAVLVTAAAILAFRAGVGVSDRAAVPTAGWATQLYYALGLFVLGGLDIGVPAGGPAWARALLWTAYFSAPALTVGALAEALLRVWNPRWWRFRGLRDHIVIVGMGQIGALYLEGLRRVDPRRRVLAVDVVMDHVNASQAQTRHGALFLNGDVANRATRETMRLDRAAGVVLATGSDLVNLEAATDILGEHPRLSGRVVAHVGDVTLERSIAEAADDGPDVRRSHHLFNGHRNAAEELVTRGLIPRFRATAAPDVVVIAGFGRFGQTILELLQVHAAGEFSAVLLIDQVAHLRRRQFEQHVGFQGDYSVEAIEADLSDPATWDGVEARLGEQPADRSVVFLLATDDDPLNLRNALAIRRLRSGAHIVVRCFSDSSLTRRLSTVGDFEVFGVSSLLRDALADHHRQWFMRRRD